MFIRWNFRILSPGSNFSLFSLIMSIIVYWSDKNSLNDVNFLNNKAKEFEMKYFKELSLRKITIDKILKEQEDDAD